MMMVYCDTSTLLNNVNRYDDEKTLKELDALQQLLALRTAGKIQMVRSRVVLRKKKLEESSETAGWLERMARLRADYEALDPVGKDEEVLGFHSQFEARGGGAYPLVSDVQDEGLRDELVQRGLLEIEKDGREDRGDAEHITQAVANKCNVFLTRDENTIIRPHRAWLESRIFPN